jgi:hypothetical protein
MKNLKPFQQPRWISFVAGGVIAACLCAALINSAKSDSLPGLSIKLVGSDQLQLTVTNGVGTTNYEIYHRLTLESTNDWVQRMVGSNGQFVFTTNMGIDLRGFFQARIGSDSDGDGVPNSIDGNPYNSAVGALTITIDSPTNGANLQ